MIIIIYMQLIITQRIGRKGNYIEVKCIYPTGIKLLLFKAKLFYVKMHIIIPSTTIKKTIQKIYSKKNQERN